MNLDGNAASHRGLWLLGDEYARWKSVVVRYCRYLNHIVEQDHRVRRSRSLASISQIGFVGDSSHSAAPGNERVRRSNNSGISRLRSLHIQISRNAGVSDHR